MSDFSERALHVVTGFPVETVEWFDESFFSRGNEFFEGLGDGDSLRSPLTAKARSRSFGSFDRLVAKCETPYKILHIMSGTRNGPVGRCVGGFDYFRPRSWLINPSAK